MAVNPITQREMQPLTSVFGGVKNTPRAVFEKAHVENAGTVANHRANDMAMACPRCDAQGVESRLFSKPDVGYYCVKEGSHRWKDHDELMAINPRKLAFKGLTARQEGWEKFTLDMPGSVLKDLQTKFGDKLAATLRAMLDTMAEGRFLLVPEEDVKRLSDHTGAELRNSTQLVGAVYSLKTTNAGLEEQNRLMNSNRRGGAVSPTAVVVELGDLVDKVTQVAESRGQTPGELLAGEVERYIAADWM